MSYRRLGLSQEFFILMIKENDFAINDFAKRKLGKINMLNNKTCISANCFKEAPNDSTMIQNAIDVAKHDGVKTVVIPELNARTGKKIWTISQTVLLPSDITLVLEDAHLQMADGVICQMFRNQNARTPIGNTLEGRQRNIRIVGRGKAILDGGVPNGLSEFTSEKDEFPHVSENLTIFLHNVENFLIENIHIVDQRWWAIALMFCEKGRIERIRFELTRHDIDSFAQWRNQDGIDLRVGCNNITIRAISGEVGDDLIALTALQSPAFEKKYTVEGKATDIHDILIHDIRGITNMCAIIRLLNHFGHRIYNITMRDIVESSCPGIENKTQMAIRIGDTVTGYYRNDQANQIKHGEIFNIHIENLYTRALTAIITCGTIKNLTARNIHLLEDGQNVYVCGGFDVNLQPFIFIPSRQNEIDKFYLLPNLAPTVAENVMIENVYYSARSTVPGEPKALFSFFETDIRNVVIKNVCNDSEIPIVKYTGTCKGKIRCEDH